MRQPGFSLSAAVERWFRPWPIQLGWFLLFSLLTRATMLGDPAYHDDETLFFLIGQKMLDGFVPYVDIWDRKGPGLFVLYAGFAAVSDSVLSYQIGALVCAALTAFVLARIAHLYTGRLGAIMAGTFYLAMLPRILGGGGQAGVFINLLVVLAAFLVLAHAVGRAPTRRSLLAMLLCGVAITFKQTSVFDGAFFGLILLWRHWREGATPGQVIVAGLAYCALGAAPMVLAGLVYVGLGHFDAFWHAMVLSNLDREYTYQIELVRKLTVLTAMVVAIVPLALIGLAKPLDFDGKQPDRVLLGLWLLVTMGQLVAVPNPVDHYLIPVLLVLCLCAATTLQREVVAMLGAVLLVPVMMRGPAFDWTDREESRRNITALATQIRADAAQPRLFLFQGPVALYSALDTLPPTPLAFPMHLSTRQERDVSQFRTMDQVRRVLAWEPTTVVIRRQQHPAYIDTEALALVHDYVSSHCRTQRTWNLPDRYGARQFDVWSDCRVVNPVG